MNIIIAGGGKVGGTVAEHLADEGHSVTIIDTSDDALERLSNQLDVMCLKGNCVSRDVLLEAGAKDCQVFIATTVHNPTRQHKSLLLHQVPVSLKKLVLPHHPQSP